MRLSKELDPIDSATGSVTFVCLMTAPSERDEEISCIADIVADDEASCTVKSSVSLAKATKLLRGEV